jgi:tetratricopeptide (TPR) repeat protein
LPDEIALAKHNAAISMLSEEINKNSSNHELYYKRAKIYFELNELKKSAEDINDALSIFANEAKYRLLKSEILREQGNFKLAYEEAKLGEILGLKTPEIYTLLGDLSLKNNIIPDSKKYLNYALEIAPNNGEVYYYFALLKTKLGDTTAAINNLNLAKQFKPKFINTYKRLSEIYANQGNTDLAKDITFELAKQYPNDAENCTILAKIYQRRSNIDSALIFYNKALQIKPNLYQASYDAGYMCLKNGYYLDALKFFESTYKYAPKTPFINTSLGMCYENIGDKEKALDYYTIAFAVNNRDFKAIEGIKRLEEPQLYYTDTQETILQKKYTNTPNVKVDTTRIRLTEIQPKKISIQKRDSSTNRLQNSNKFPIPIIK